VRRTLLVVAALVVLAAVGLAGTWIGRRSAGSGRPEVVAPRTVVGATTGARGVDHDRVVALGRIRPSTRVRVAGPARPSVVIGKLLVDQGDQVTAGQEIAELDSVSTETAEVEVARVELTDSQRDLDRARSLFGQGVSSRAVLDAAVSRRDRAAARLTQAKAELERSHVRAPISGVVLTVFARDGERVGNDGILELADTSRMLAVAEVPEAEIPGVRLGQLAEVRSATLPGGTLRGKVTRIGSKVQQQEVVSADPVADLDARVIEVEVQLEKPAAAASLTNLRVEVEIDFASRSGG
jgi:HlyD family secretion protein